MMVLRFFFALMALITGMAAAQSAVAFSAVQSSVDAAPVCKGAAVAQGAEQKFSVNFNAIAPFLSHYVEQPTTSFPRPMARTFSPLPVTFIGDRQRV
jgi:hypothetical protein